MEDLEELQPQKKTIGEKIQRGGLFGFSPKVIVFQFAVFMVFLYGKT